MGVPILLERLNSFKKSFSWAFKGPEVEALALAVLGAAALAVATRVAGTLVDSLVPGGVEARVAAAGWPK